MSNKSSNKSNNRSYKKKYNPKKECVRDEETRPSNSNSPEWYAKDAHLVRDTASIPYGYAIGGNPGCDGILGEPVPGIYAMHFLPVPGAANNNPNAPVNLASRALFVETRKENAGRTNYDAPDEMLYMLAMDSLYTYHAWMRRLYGVLSLFSKTNRYYPKALVKAMRGDYDDLTKNMANFRAYINIFASKLGKFAVPASMTYMVRHYWLASHYFLDGMDGKSQTYVFVPDGFMQYDEESADVAFLKYTPLGGERGAAPLTFNRIVNYGNQLLDAVMQSQDLIIISGDILKAFAPEQLISLEFVAEDYAEAPSVSYEVLSQIENAFIFDWNPEQYTVKQVVNDLTTDTYLTAPIKLLQYKVYHAETPDVQVANNHSFVGSMMLNMHKSDVTPEDTMVASRFMINDWELTDDGYMIARSAGSEILVNAFMFRLDDKGRELIIRLCSSTGDSVTATGGVGPLTLMRMAASTRFDWFPRFIANTILDRAGGCEEAACSWDVANYAVVSPETMRQMHEVALLSELTDQGFGSKVMAG